MAGSLSGKGHFTALGIVTKRPAQVWVLSQAEAISGGAIATSSKP